jgi:hypothetical protein
MYVCMNECVYVDVGFAHVHTYTCMHAYMHA